jgi:hypothetical protein
MKLLLSDKRVDPSVHVTVIRKALERANIDILRLLLADNRIVITNKLLLLLRSVDYHDSSNRVDALFDAAHPYIWPMVVGNDVDCIPRDNGHLRNKLDGLQLKSSWMLLLCVKRKFTPRVAARVGDVLRDVCAERTGYQSREVEPSEWDDDAWSDDDDDAWSDDDDDDEDDYDEDEYNEDEYIDHDE